MRSVGSLAMIYNGATGTMVQRWRYPGEHPAIPTAPARIRFSRGIGVEAPVSVSTPPGAPTPSDEESSRDRESRPLIFCGMCGALNPATNHYCAACGTTLV